MKVHEFKKPLPGPPHMENGVFYDLVKPAEIKGKIFNRVQCEFRVPGHPNEYVVRGISKGGKEVESFILRFTGNGKVVTRRSESQSGFGTPESPASNEPKKYKIGERIKCSGWGGNVDFGEIIEIKWIFHARLNRWTWGYKVNWENNGPNLAFVFSPEGYLEKA